MNFQTYVPLIILYTNKQTSIIVITNMCGDTENNVNMLLTWQTQAITISQSRFIAKATNVFNYKFRLLFIKILSSSGAAY